MSHATDPPQSTQAEKPAPAPPSLTRGSVASALFHMAVPMLGGTFAMNAFNLTDTWFVSQLGTLPLAAMGVNAMRIVGLLVPLSLLGSRWFGLNGVLWSRAVTDLTAGLGGILWSGHVLHRIDPNALDPDPPPPCAAAPAP